MFCSKHLCGHRWESNPRHPACKAGVLPTELLAQVKKVFDYTPTTSPQRHTLHNELEKPVEKEPCVSNPYTQQGWFFSQNRIRGDSSPKIPYGDYVMVHNRKPLVIGWCEVPSPRGKCSPNGIRTRDSTVKG